MELSRSLGRIQTDINLIRKPRVLGRLVPLLIMAVMIISLSAAVLFLDALPAYRTNGSLEDELRQKETQLEAMKQDNSSYEDIYGEYIRYGTGYLTPDEAAYEDRLVILSKIDSYLIAGGAVMKLRLSDNILLTTVYEASMGTASSIISRMLSDSDGSISYATATAADNDSGFTDEATGEEISIPTVSLRVIFAGSSDSQEGESVDQVNQE